MFNLVAHPYNIMECRQYKFHSHWYRQDRRESTVCPPRPSEILNMPSTSISTSIYELPLSSTRNRHFGPLFISKPFASYSDYRTVNEASLATRHSQRKDFSLEVVKRARLMEARVRMSKGLAGEGGLPVDWRSTRTIKDN
jgi:hypothetical protein